MASPLGHPVSYVPSDSVLGTISIRDKSLLKRKINRHHNNNTSAGYVPVHEEDLHKTGLRGRKSYLFWTVIAVLCILAFVNLVLLTVIFSILRVGLGMESLEVSLDVIPQHSFIKFYGKTDLGEIFKKDGIIRSFRDVPLIITAEQSHVFVNIATQEYENQHLHKVMSLEENQTLFQNVKSFQVKDPKTRCDIFSTSNPNFGLPKGVQKLLVDYATTSKISSPVNENLSIRSDSFIRFKGNEGTRMEGKYILLSADQYLFLKSVNGSIILNGSKGVTIDFNQMPEAASGTSGLPFVSQFKICVCMPSGKLFRVAVHPGQSSHTACNRANMVPHIDPCRVK